MMTDVLGILELCGIIPVVVIDDDARAVPLASALLAGGLSTMEVTFRTQAAEHAIDRITKAVPSMVIGAGTVLSVEQAKSAIGAGARYIVSPGLNRKVVEYCRSVKMTVIPGVATPSDVEAALDLGLTVVKFFPAEANGGLEYLQAMSAPFRQLRFIPTGGIDESNLLSYLKFPPVVACGGSWMVKADLIGAGAFDQITHISARAVSTMLGFRLAQVGIHSGSPQEAAEDAGLLSRVFRMDLSETAQSVSVESQFEFMKQKSPGTRGHIAIGTHFLQRAVAYCSAQGIGILENTRTEKRGKLHSVFLDKEVGGFAILLIQV